MIYGERIRQVRELMGWTQSEAAELLGLSQPFIAKLEGDRLSAPDQFVEKLSLTSGFSPSFFTREPQGDFPAGSLLFRSHMSMTSKEATEIYRYAEMTFDVFRSTMTRGKLKPLPLNLPNAVSDDPREAAAVTRSELGLSPDKPIAHLTNTLEKAGVLILGLPRPFEHREAFSLWAGFDRSCPVIVLADGKVGDRLRMNIAHELAHLVMHKPITNAVYEIEKQAFQFAAEFLMPEKQMRSEIVPPVNLDTFASLKPRWGVAISALIVRARELQIINQRKYTYLFQQLSSRGWRTREPKIADVPVEKPRLVRQVAEIAYGNPVRYKKMAEDLGMPESLIKGIIEAHAIRTTATFEETSKSRGEIVQFERAAKSNPS